MSRHKQRAWASFAPMACSSPLLPKVVLTNAFVYLFLLSEFLY